MLILNRKSNCGSRRTTLKTWILLLPLFACNTSAQNYSENCIPFEHRQTARRVLSKINGNVAPCDDFYQFACGNFIDNNPPPDHDIIVDIEYWLDESLDETLRDIVKREVRNNEPKHYRLPNELFKACMNTAQLDKLDVRTLKKIKDSLGDWPVTVRGVCHYHNWEILTKKLRRIGSDTNYLMHFSVGKNVKNRTGYMIELGEPLLEFGMSVFEYTHADYLELMVNTAVLLGANKARAKRELKKVLTFEEKLVLLRDSSDSYLNYVRTIRELQDSYPCAEWLDLINGLLPEGLQVDENERILVSEPSYFTGLCELLEMTDTRTVTNYVMWKFYFASLNFLSDKFRYGERKFRFIALDKPLEDDRTKYCEDIVLKNLQIPLSSLYIRHNFKKENNRAVLSMFNQIRNAFIQTLNETQWLAMETKKEAIRKLELLRTVIGFPDEMFSNNILEEYYRELEVYSNQYFESYLNIRIFNLDKTFAQVKNPESETSWIMHVRPRIMGAYYHEVSNVLHVAAGYIQGPMFNIQRPNFMNYGSIGAAIGHEMGHSLSDSGLLYNADGERSNWLDPISTEAINEATSCFIAQYSNYTDITTGICINGSNTVDENIADNVGLKLSYLAYTNWVAQHGEERRLHGTRYTPKQMFWISFAQRWCSLTTPAAIEDIIDNESHAPPEFRVLGTLRNMEAFSRDFQCPPNSPMNPVRKCTFW